MRWFRVVRRRRRVRKSKATRAHYFEHREHARTLIHERLVYWNAFYNLSYNRVAIRDQGTRWGSCSKKGNLNFNYRLAFLKGELLDYVIVHELCHLLEFNHGPNFWSHVERAIPDYREKRAELKLVPILGVSQKPVPVLKV